MGYADAKGETNRLLFYAFLSNQTGVYSYGLLTIIANNAMKTNWHSFADDTRKLICYNDIIKK